MLDARRLTVSHGRVPALRHVDLTVLTGELVVVVGPNGAGKTTLMRSLAGLHRAESGTVMFRGEDITRRPPEEIVRRGLSLVPEGRHVFTSLTVDENLRLGGLPVGRVVQLAEVFDHFPILAGLRGRRASTLSGGEQQMLAIGRAMVARPRLMALDEPTLGLAPMVVEAVFAALTRLNDAGTSILLVEQNSRRALAAAHRAYALQKGEVVAVADRTVLADPAVLNAFAEGELVPTTGGRS